MLNLFFLVMSVLSSHGLCIRARVKVLGLTTPYFADSLPRVLLL